MPESPNYYEILQIPRDATIEEIKTAFRRLVRQYHPDLNPENPAASAEKFREICEAYKILSDSVRRREYNQKSEFDRSEQTTNRLNYQDFYVRGVEKALEKDYQEAIENYTLAIQLNPGFVEAYLKRCEARYKLRDDRGVLEDCRQALEIDPNCAQAYYYQGRSRFRLGYTQSAIEAYTQAIGLEKDYAQAYYHRGLANHELKEHQKGVKDLQTAAELFRAQGDLSGYHLANDTLENLNKTKPGNFSVGNIAAGVKATLRDALKAFTTFIINPGGGLLPAFARLERQQALVVGILYGAIADFCFVCGAYIGWRDLLRISLFKLSIIGLLPFVSLVAVSAIARLISRRRLSFAGDVFLAGASLLPVGFLGLASGFSTSLPSIIMVIFTIFAWCYTILTLYSGCTQISNLSEATAALVVPVMLLVAGSPLWLLL
ncbi:MAG: DnaJ domain-containing protein [Xenococcaceae cyanobacterium]